MLLSKGKYLKMCVKEWLKNISRIHVYGTANEGESTSKCDSRAHWTVTSPLRTKGCCS